MPTHKIILAAATVALGLGAAGGVLAAGKAGDEAHESQEMAAIRSVPVTLQQAITTAEGETKGRAIAAGAEDVSDRVLYEIELVATDGTLQKAYVDATSGAIIQAVAAEDHGDRDGDHEDGDDDHEKGGQDDQD